MKSDEAPGISGRITDMCKSLPKNALDFIVETIQEYWIQDTDFTAWYTTIMNVLHRAKVTPKTSKTTKESA